MQKLILWEHCKNCEKIIFSQFVINRKLAQPISTFNFFVFKLVGVKIESFVGIALRDEKILA